MSGLRWAVEGADWPLRAHSRFVESVGMRWHVQMLGSGPAALLIHGTGASSHSWRDVAPPLAERFSLIIPDLPGHAFTTGRPAAGLTLVGMAGALGALLAALEVAPAIVASHSAGTAIAAHMALSGTLSAPIVGFGPALLPFEGAAAPLASGLARLLFLNPFAPRLFAGIARQGGRTERFLARSTGSTIDARGVELYGRLFAASDHCGGAIEMMARWELGDLAARLPQLPVPLAIFHGERDTAIRAADARRAAALAGGTFTMLPGLGHLAHEERPAEAAALIAQVAEEVAAVA